jgi:hypothetical protein
MAKNTFSSVSGGCGLRIGKQEKPEASASQKGHLQVFPGRAMAAQEARNCSRREGDAVPPCWKEKEGKSSLLPYNASSHRQRNELNHLGDQLGRGSLQTAMASTHSNRRIKDQ